jgi:protein with PEP-CTERM/exosortase system signal
MSSEFITSIRFTIIPKLRQAQNAIIFLRGWISKLDRRAYTETEKFHLFNVDMFLPYLPFWPGVDPPPDSPSVSGTATLLNAVGQPIGSPNVLNSFLDGGPNFQPDVQVFFTPDFSVTPVDIHGIQFDLELSDSPGKFFSNAPRSNSMFFGGFFGVGPGKIPADVVPDRGSTFLLLTLGLLGLVSYRRQLLRGQI